MGRIFSNPVTALAAGLCLRLFFVLKLPAVSGDSELYEQLAVNWLRHGCYGMEVNGGLQPVNLRMPGYPAYLVIAYWLTGRTGSAALLAVMLGQVAVDLLGCLVVAQLAKVLAEVAGIREAGALRKVWLAALWLAALCPFTANYCAVPLTEVFAMLFTALTCCLLVAAVRLVKEPSFRMPKTHSRLSRGVEYTALGAGFVVGAGTLFRPETPLLLAAGFAVIAWQLARRRMWMRVLWTGAAMALGLLGPLIPWEVRNQITLNETQFLAPKNSNLPGELVPYGFMAWEKTWLYRMKDNYLAAWKVDEESIDAETLPARAFDTPEEKQRVAMILQSYNDDLTLTKEQDTAFAELARERTARYPLRTYVWLPMLRVVTMWFTPRIELLPVSGTVFPLVQSWQDDPIDQSVTVVFFLLNMIYVGLGMLGAVKLWRWSTTARPALIFVALFVVVRTVFLTTLETPEPRYVLECFPALIALAACAVGGRMAGRPHNAARL
jgi:4-amino-4-deoxy-L-arabinose transferase-like glycosyltransferase